MRPVYIICIYFGRQIAIPYIIIWKFIRPSILIPVHIINPPCLYYDLTLFRVSLFFQSSTRWLLYSRWNQDSSVKITWFKSFCTQSRCSTSHLLWTAFCAEIEGITPLVYVHWGNFEKTYFEQFGFSHSTLLLKETLSLHLSSTLCSTSESTVSIIYWSSVAVVAGEWPCPGRSLTHLLLRIQSFSRKLRFSQLHQISLGSSVLQWFLAYQLYARLCYITLL